MRIYTDGGNLKSCKLLVAASLSNIKASVNFVKHEEKTVNSQSLARLPVLETPEGNTLFSSNAACRFLLAEGGNDIDDTKVDQWVEWESSLLQPLLHRLLMSSYTGKLDQTLVTSVKGLLKPLEDCLCHYIVGESISAADICIWCTLFPIFYPETNLKDFRSSFQKLAQWFDKLYGQAHFQEAISSVLADKTWDSIKASVTASPVPLPPVQKCNQASGPASEKCSSKSGSTSELEPCQTQLAASSEELEDAEKWWLDGVSKVGEPRKRPNPVLPIPGAKNMLITSALPYVNNVPHLGNIIGCVLSADVYSRFCRLRNYNSLYICGTDEYGTATETKALEEGITPQQICDKYNKLHSEIYEWFNIGFDYFGRTTTQQQTEIAQDIFWKLKKNNYILKADVEQLQCLKCDRFLADRFVEGTCPVCNFDDARGDQCDACGKLINAIELKNPRCKLCTSPPVVKVSSHLFMDLPNLEPLLVKHLDSAFEKGIWSNNTKVITRSWLRDGLKPRCITRDLKWGTPVPLEGYTDKVFYVWYDAPIGYISITANYTDQWEKWWKNPDQVELYNFMAKDNVPFHSVIFPSSLLGTGDNWTVVNHLSATEYFNYEEAKFSKSRGIGVFGNDAQHTGIPSDIWRFYLLFLRPEGQDSAFSWDDFVLKNNSELLNNLGNFINRALMFVNNSFNGTIPKMTLIDEDKELIALVTRELKSYVSNLEAIKLRDGIRNILSISRLGNQYMQASKPWVLVKGSDADKARAGTIVGLAANVSCLLSVMVQPYMPTVCQTIQTQLSAPARCNLITEHFVCHLPENHKIGKPSPLFQKIEPQLVQDLKKRFAGQQATATTKNTSKVKGQTGTKEEINPGVKPIASPEEIDRLTKAVTEQGEIVRQLKTEKADKEKIDAEVATLIELKKQLALSQGLDPSAASSGGKKKKGKKK